MANTRPLSLRYSAGCEKLAHASKLARYKCVEARLLGVSLGNSTCAIHRATKVYKALHVHAC